MLNRSMVGLRVVTNDAAELACRSRRRSGGSTGANDQEDKSECDNDRVADPEPSAW